MHNRELHILAVVVTALVAADALATPAILLWARFFPENYSLLVAPSASTVDGGAAVLNILTMIVFGRWIYVAGKNVIAMGHDSLQFTPGARIWWFAVPIACLFKPFQGMRELWNASHGEVEYERNHPLIALWWALWIGGGLFSTVLNFSVSAGDDSLTMWAISCMITVSLAGVAITMLWRITQAQLRPAAPEMAEIFA